VINLYGILISLSLLICIFIIRYLSRYNSVISKGRELIWDISFWGIISGLIGARILHVLSAFPYYQYHPIRILFLWQGGLSIWGALLGGTLGIILFLRIKNIKPFSWLDIFSVTLPLGQAIGRWGNYFNKEIYGGHTNLPWGININGSKHHPLFLYESVLNIVNFLFLFTLYKKKANTTKPGYFFHLYLFNYSLIRLFMEFLRTDHWVIGKLNISLIIPILLIIIIYTSMYVNYFRKK